MTHHGPMLTIIPSQALSTLSPCSIANVRGAYLAKRAGWPWALVLEVVLLPAVVLFWDFPDQLERLAHSDHQLSASWLGADQHPLADLGWTA